LAFLLVIYACRTRRWAMALVLLTAILGGGALAAWSVHNVGVATTAAAGGATAVEAQSATSSPIPATPSAASRSAPVFVKRFSDVSSEMTSYNSKTDAAGAVRERLEMWHTAGHAFMAHPLAGVGIDQFGAFARRQVAMGLSNSAIEKYEHPHNEYLEAAATGGIPGLIVILLTFAIPLVYFIRHVCWRCDCQHVRAVRTDRQRVLSRHAAFAVFLSCTWPRGFVGSAQIIAGGRAACLIRRHGCVST